MHSDGDVSASGAYPRPITIAIVALGGQGGGVLSGWIVKAAEAAGYLAQSTSVPGVAQRTGSTVYCIELYPEAAAKRVGRDPVLALMPMPGDVDVVIASELMEAGRAIVRGFVTPDLTTLVASTHREYAISEKSALGSGIANGEAVLTTAREQSKRLVAFDMRKAAEDAGSAISAALLGALAGSGALPIARERFESSIRAGGRMVEENLAAFAAAYERAEGKAEDKSEELSATPIAPRPRSPAARAIVDRIEVEFPAALRDVLLVGARRCADFQDPQYAALYLDRIAGVVALESGHVDTCLLARECARHLALRMTYEDTIRVADLKTRPERFQRNLEQLGARSDEVVKMTEYMHPRIEEIADTCPVALGQWILRSKLPKTLLSPFLKKGRHVRTTTLSHFLLLRTLASLRKIRRSTLRYKIEDARIEDWLQTVLQTAPSDYDLAVQVARCQRVVKGYGETYERGLKKFAQLMNALEYLRGRADGASRFAALQEAALADEDDNALKEELRKLKSPEVAVSGQRAKC
ncbi:MAG: indolepyruvate oxidoreductase subunit beta family protein [Woeseia sp.]